KTLKQTLLFAIATLSGIVTFSQAKSQVVRSRSVAVSNGASIKKASHGTDVRVDARANGRAHANAKANSQAKVNANENSVFGDNSTHVTTKKHAHKKHYKKAKKNGAHKKHDHYKKEKIKENKED
ncbi:MAG: hypothetical protein ABIN97_16620, partial [Ginsengibacter sp.]